ncbi:hypothetical protein ACLB1Q_14535 [Escherichia coli]
MILTLRYRSLKSMMVTAPLSWLMRKVRKFWGDAGNLQLQDKMGKSSPAVPNVISAEWAKVVGTYDYRLTSGVNNDGLYIGYGLTQLDLHATDSDALVLSSNGKSRCRRSQRQRYPAVVTWHSAARRVRPISHSNKDNDYTGVTDLRSGTLFC